MALNVTNKTAIVTGAGSGINFAFAKLLLSKNCNVVIADLVLRPEAKALVEEYSKGDGGPRAVFVQTDVSDWKQLERMFEVAEKEFGSADVVVPGAGVYEPPWSNFWQPPGTPGSASKDTIESSRYALVDININHPIRTTQLAIAHFLKHNKNGVITHITSIAGQVANFNSPIYVATKHALNGFIRSLAALEIPYSMASPGNLEVLEPAPGQENIEKGRPLPKIRVNGVAPGLIKTPLWTEAPDKMAGVTQVTDWVTPEEVAEAMLKCIEDEEIVGGSIIEVAGSGTRRVEPFMDKGPEPGRHKNTEPVKWVQDIWNRLSQIGWGQ